MLTLDIGHAHIGSKNERRALQFMDAYPDRIQHIHVSDNFGKEDSHLPIGAGNIRYKEMVKGLKKIGYNGTITVEVFSSDREFLRFSKERVSQLFERA
jgi:sugar phosphate isomerase/epimerase